jgi:F0F1-type ATP synthase assembly protein I
MNLKARLIADWQWVLKRSWSVRFLALAALLSGLEALLPLLSAFFPRGVFALLSFFTTAAAFAARFVAQSKED